MLKVSFERSKQESEYVPPIFSWNNLNKKVKNGSWWSIESLILSKYKIKLHYKILPRDGYLFNRRIILTDWIFDLLKSSLYSCRMSVFDQKMSQVMVKVQFEKKNHDRIEFMLKVAVLRPPFVTWMILILGQCDRFQSNGNFRVHKMYSLI